MLKLILVRFVHEEIAYAPRLVTPSSTIIDVIVLLEVYQGALELAVQSFILPVPEIFSRPSSVSTAVTLSLVVAPICHVPVAAFAFVGIINVAILSVMQSITLSNFLSFFIINLAFEFFYFC